MYYGNIRDKMFQGHNHQHMQGVKINIVTSLYKVLRNTIKLGRNWWSRHFVSDESPYCYFIILAYGEMTIYRLMICRAVKQMKFTLSSL